MERHLAWLVALIVVLLAWFGLLCCGASAKKRARTHHHDSGSQPREFTSSNINEGSHGTERCSHDRLSELCDCGESSRGERLKEAGSIDTAAETHISIQGMDVVVSVQDVEARTKCAAEQDCESAGTLQDVEVQAGQEQDGSQESKD